MLEQEELLSVESCKRISTAEIFEKQIKNEEIIVISAFPEFLIDYFKEEDLQDFIFDRTIPYNRKDCEFLA